MGVRGAVEIESAVWVQYGRGSSMIHGAGIPPTHGGHMDR